MKHLILVVAAGIILWSLPVWAEMYRYTDAGGVDRFTDNLANVPENQRTGISVLESESSPVAPPSAEQPSAQTPVSGQALKMPEKPESTGPGADSLKSDSNSNDPSRIDQLLKTKTVLDAENAQFMKESLALSEEKKTLSGSVAIKAFNEKVSALNARVEDYEKRRAAFQKEADDFDASLQKRMAPAPQSPQP